MGDILKAALLCHVSCTSCVLLQGFTVPLTDWELQEVVGILILRQRNPLSPAQPDSKSGSRCHAVDVTLLVALPWHERQCFECQGRADLSRWPTFTNSLQPCTASWTWLHLAFCCRPTKRSCDPGMKHPPYASYVGGHANITHTYSSDLTLNLGTPLKSHRINLLRRADHNDGIAT